jgi:hypothetical protein
MSKGRILFDTNLSSLIWPWSQNRHSGAALTGRTRNPGIFGLLFWIPGSAARPRNDELAFVTNLLDRRTFAQAE